jgi:hypothetical protein
MDGKLTFRSQPLPAIRELEKFKITENPGYCGVFYPVFHQVQRSIRPTRSTVFRLIPFKRQIFSMDVPFFRAIFPKLSPGGLCNNGAQNHFLQGLIIAFRLLH